MPENKFNFSPENLHIAGADYKGVRTFALEIRHLAGSNYAIWSAQSRNPEGFVRLGPQSGFYVGAGEYAATAGARQIDPPAPGRFRIKHARPSVIRLKLGSVAARPSHYWRNPAVADVLTFEVGCDRKCL
jgi:hypothetical protein